jgi:hypothetical protein
VAKTPPVHIPLGLEQPAGVRSRPRRPLPRAGQLRWRPRIRCEIPGRTNSGDQLRDQRGQRRRYWPPFDPWTGSVRSWVGLTVVRGVQLGP